MFCFMTETAESMDSAVEATTFFDEDDSANKGIYYGKRFFISTIFYVQIPIDFK